MEKSWKPDPIAILAFLLAAAAIAWLAWKEIGSGGGNKIAFVDTQRLMTGFKEAHKVNKELEAADGKWRLDLKTMDDSLKAFMDSMTVKYDGSDVKAKKGMQEELALRNQQMNNFERVNVRKMQDLTQEKMAKVYDKVNVLMKEYGKSHGYEIIFGTANGSILYGEGNSSDITDEIVKVLNSRFE